MDARIGELAALGTSVLWTVTALAFERAALRIGSLALNLLRLVAALILFAAVGLVARGELLPSGADGAVWFWLSLSGLVGFVFGDLLLFQAYIDIGARFTQVLFASAPLMAALLGYVFLGERLGPLALVGMAIVVAAIALVILDRRPAPSGSGPAAGPSAGPGTAVAPERRLRGVLCGFGAALGQAGGLVLSKIGAPSFDPFAATEIRVIAGIAGFLVVAALSGRFAEPWRALRDRGALGYLSIGAFFGPFLGVTLGLFAVQRSSAGVASTLMALTPILILAPSAALTRQRITLREAGAAAAAVAGSALLFLG